MNKNKPKNGIHEVIKTFVFEGVNIFAQKFRNILLIQFLFFLFILYFIWKANKWTMSYILICTNKGSGSWTYQFRITYFQNCCWSPHRRWHHRSNGSSIEESTCLVPCPCDQREDQPTLARHTHKSLIFCSAARLPKGISISSFMVSMWREYLPRRSSPHGPQEWMAEGREDPG